MNVKKMLRKLKSVIKPPFTKPKGKDNHIWEKIKPEIKCPSKK